MRALRVTKNSPKALQFSFIDRDGAAILVSDRAPKFLVVDCEEKTLIEKSATITFLDDYTIYIPITGGDTLSLPVNDWHEDVKKYWLLYLDDTLIERGVFYIDKTAQKLPILLECVLS